MRKPGTLILGLVVAAMAAFFVIVAWSMTTSKFHAQSRLKLEVKETHFFPSFNRDEYACMSNFLNSANTRLALATESGISEKEFVITKVGPVRGTSLFYINCSATDSNKVQGVASNAARMILLLYATNQPSWQVTYIDSGCFIPPSFVERLRNFLGL